jgi:hypothetical protein
MAEEEKVQVDEISNKALNQLKKTFEPTAEEKFEAKRIKAALASGGGGAGIAGAAAGMFGKKGGGFFKGLGKWLAIPVVMMASGIMKMGKGAWNMLTKMIKIIFWPIRWLLGMTGSKAIKDVGGVVKKTGKLGGMLGIFSKIMLPFVWITTIWAGWEGWLAAKDRNSDGVVSTYEKFLGGLEEMLKWLTLGFVDFSTFEKVKEKWAAFSFEKWVDDMVIAFGKFPEDLAKWMDNKTKGLGGFVESFGKILKEFLFGKSATATTSATGGVMGWMAENLSVDKVSNAMIGGIKLAVAFGKMLVRIGMIALIGTTGKEGQPETWTSTSLFGIINQKVEPNLKPIAKSIGNTIMSLLKWIDDIVGNVMRWVGDQLIAAGEAEGASGTSKFIAKGIKAGRHISEVLEPEKNRARWIKDRGGDPSDPNAPEGRTKEAQKTTWYRALVKKQQIKAKALGVKMRKEAKENAQDIENMLELHRKTEERLGPEGHGKISTYKGTKLERMFKGIITSLFGDSAIKGVGVGLGKWDDKGKFGPKMWNKIGHRGMSGVGWNRTGMKMQQYTMMLETLLGGSAGKELGFGKEGITLTSGRRSAKQQSASMMGLESLGVYRQEMKDFLTNLEKTTGVEPGTLLHSKNTKADKGNRKIAVDALISEFTRGKYGTDFFQHMHGNAIDFAYPSGWKAENFPALRRMIESALPGTKLLSHDGHLHLQRNINAGADALNQGVKINEDWQKVWTMLNAGNGGGGTTNNYITTHDDHSTQNGGATLVASGTENKHTSNVQDTTMNPHWGVG